MVGFPACITVHMTGGSASRGVCIQWGVHPGGGVCIWGICILGMYVFRGSASRGMWVCIWGVCIQRGVCLQGGLHPGKGGLHPGEGGLHPRGSASRGRGSASRGCACIQWGCASRGVGQTPSPPPETYGILRDTVNKRAVRILLECILLFLEK